MRYILLIHAEEQVWTRYDEKAQADQMNRHQELERDLREAGKYVDCGGLATTNTATTVRYKEGESLVTDGPYAEAREQFGGYYVVDADGLDDAIARKAHSGDQERRSGDSKDRSRASGRLNVPVARTALRRGSWGQQTNGSLQESAAWRTTDGLFRLRIHPRADRVRCRS